MGTMSKKEHEAIDIFCPGIDLEDIDETRLSNMYKNILYRSGDEDEFKSDEDKELIKSYIKERMDKKNKSVTVDPTSENYGKYPLNTDCLMENDEICKSGKYYYDKKCYVTPKLKTERLDTYYIYILIAILFVMLLIVLFILVKRERGDGSETITDNYVPGKAVKEIENL